MGGEEEQVNASEKGFEREQAREQANKDEEACAVCVCGGVTAEGCISLKLASSYCLKWQSYLRPETDDS